MTTTRPTETRITIIDALRGFCLVSIFINHISIGSLRDLSPSRIFFFDSADAFVFLAGISSFLAYGAGQRSMVIGQSVARIWRRALILYLANAFLAVMSVMILVGFAAYMPDSPFLDRPDTLIASHGSWTYVTELLLLRQDVGYTVVLRLYVLLMLVAPLYVWLAAKRFWLPLLPAAAIWLASGHYGVFEFNSLTEIPRSMAFLAWNFVFAAGISLGAAINSHERLKVTSTRLFLAFTVAVVLPVGIAQIGHNSPDVLAWFETRNDFFWTGASKSLQSPLRIANLFAVTYLVIALARAPVMRLLHSVSNTNLFVVLGRKSLDVFMLGAMLSLIAERAQWMLAASNIAPLASPPAIAAEIILCLCGIWAMFALARNEQVGIKQLEQSFIRWWAKRLSRSTPITANTT